MKQRVVTNTTWLAMMALGLATLHAAHPDPLRPDLMVDEVAILERWARPEYPVDALQEKVGGEVRVRFVTDASGGVTSARVLEAPDPRLGAAAVAAVKLWAIEAPMEDGMAVAGCFDVTLEFSPGKPFRQGGVFPEAVARTPAYPLETPEGDYPDLMRDRQLSGAVVFHGTVTETGAVVSRRLIHASHVDFVWPALASLAKWKFQPEMQGDLARRSEVQGRMTFTAEDVTPAEVLATNGITLPDGGSPELAPVIVVACDAVWPLDVLIAGEDGRATVEFTVTDEGRVRHLMVVDASHREFGSSLMAAMETWVFGPQPDVMDGMIIRQRSPGLKEMRLRRTVEFRAVPKRGDAGGGSWATLVEAVRAGSVQTAKGLDGKLTPIYRVSPRYPGVLAGQNPPAGEAMLDVIVDRDGRVRLPRIVSATHEEFGWAAATAAAQWVFQPPTRKGEPTDVKVRIPFKFAPPAE